MEPDSNLMDEILDTMKDGPIEGYDALAHLESDYTEPDILYNLMLLQDEGLVVAKWKAEGLVAKVARKKEKETVLPEVKTVVDPDAQGLGGARLTLDGHRILDGEDDSAKGSVWIPS